jgi:hypothetical protein
MKMIITECKGVVIVITGKYRFYLNPNVKRAHDNELSTGKYSEGNTNKVCISNVLAFTQKNLIYLSQDKR